MVVAQLEFSRRTDSCNESGQLVLYCCMKTLAILAAAALFTGCATAPTTTTTSTTTTTASRSALHPDERRAISKRTHTQEELQKTGHPTIGGALQTVEPSLFISGGR